MTAPAYPDREEAWSILEALEASAGQAVRCGRLDRARLASENVAEVRDGMLNADEIATYRGTWSGRTMRL